MISKESLVQLRAFAMQDGLIVALFWIVSFFLTIYMPQTSLGGLLLLATPFVMAWRLCVYRDKVLNGAISYKRGFLYLISISINAAIIFAVVQGVYFLYLDNGTFRTVLLQASSVVSEVYRSQGIPAEDINASIELITTMPPMHLSLIFMMQNIIICFFMGLIIALLCSRRKNVRK